jgi:beta-ureidopropionase / N-carbamoyl-L-amino-acid hydrolase
MPTIDPDRILGDLRELARFGAYRTGVHRPTFSEDDVAARRWFQSRLEEAGLDASIDGIGSVFGFAPGPGPALLTGSHLESQNYAGWLDGPLGCVYGLETVRALAEDPATAHLKVDVAAFCDEEGHFGSFLGSRSFIGQLTEEDIGAARHKVDGTPFTEALARAGFAGLPRQQASPGRYRGYLEAHIEQGSTLEEAGRRIGAVTAVVAIWQYRITLTGEQNHAGTTSMRRRRDAGLALTRLLGAIDRRFPEIAAERTVWTTGRITLEPGAASVVPGRAEALFQFRDADPAVLERLGAELERLVAEADGAGPCRIVLETLSRSVPALMDDGVQRAVEEAAEAREPGSSLRLPSGAGHDAQVLARIMPAGMLFVPSIGGISHHWTENTSDADIVFGAQVFCDAVVRLLQPPSPGWERGRG